MADEKTIVIEHEIIAKALSSMGDTEMLPSEVMRAFDNAFTQLCDGKIADIKLFADCPCKLKATLELGERAGGLEFDFHKCDLCDHGVADKQGRKVSEMIHLMVRSWAGSVGKQTLKEAVGRVNNIDPDQVGIALDPETQELADKVGAQWRAMCVLAEMLNILITNPEVAKIEGMHEVIVDMSKTWGAIVSDFNLRGVPSKDGAVQEAEQIIKDSRGSENGGTHESDER